MKGDRNYVPMRYEIVVKGAMKRRCWCRHPQSYLCILPRKPFKTPNKVSLSAISHQSRGDKNNAYNSADKQMKDFKEYATVMMNKSASSCRVNPMSQRHPYQDNEQVAGVEGLSSGLLEARPQRCCEIHSSPTWYCNHSTGREE